MKAEYDIDADNYESLIDQVIANQTYWGFL
jgi:hypothetical protein